MKQTEYKGLRFGSLSPEASDEMQKAILGGLKAINEYFDSSDKEKKFMMQDIKVATTALGTYAKLRQAESGYAMILLQLAKISKEGKDALKYFIIDAIPQLTEKKTKEGNCRRCESKFELEDWQHSSMHWCPDCRKLDTYKNFRQTHNLGNK